MLIERNGSELNEEFAIWGFIYMWGLVAVISTLVFLFTYFGYTHEGTGNITMVKKGNFNNYMELECQTKKGEHFQGYIERSVGSRRNRNAWYNQLQEGDQVKILYARDAEKQDIAKVRLKVDFSRALAMIFILYSLEIIALLCARWLSNT